jgi:hypothetical protein
MKLADVLLLWKICRAGGRFWTVQGQQSSARHVLWNGWKVTEEEKTTRYNEAFSQAALAQTEGQAARHRLVDEMDDCHQGLTDT